MKDFRGFILTMRNVNVNFAPGLRIGDTFYINYEECKYLLKEFKKINNASFILTMRNVNRSLCLL